MAVPLDYEHILELVDTRWRQLGFDYLMREERDYLLVWWLEAECSNGTLHQYFSNSSGDVAEETLEALRRIGANGAAAILQRAMKLLGPDYPVNRATRNLRLGDIPNQYEAFDQLNEELFEQPDPVVQMAIDRLGTAYEAEGISLSQFERKTPLQFTTIVVLILVALGAMGTIGLLIAAR